MRLARLVVLLLAVLVLAACAQDQTRVLATAPASSELDMLMYGAAVPASQRKSAKRTAQQAVPVAATVSVAEPMGGPYVPAPESFGPYTLDSGDKLRIVVFGQDNLSNTYSVDAAGQVTMPLIGAVMARGLTTQQLSGAIAGRLKQSFIRDPSVAIEVEIHRPFFVLGEVTYPGQYPYVPHMTVENAVSIAGGFTPRGFKFNVTVTRKQEGVPTRFSLPLSAAIRPGDIVTVAERWF